MSLITTTAELDALCRRLRSAEYVAVDTEFMRERSYWPRLCLVQLAGPDEALAVDPLAEGIELAPLLALMRDTTVTKVFHAARQDVEIFVNLDGSVPTPLFDTQVAAMVCGFGDSVGYEKLAARLAGARINKASQFTDWARRPLSSTQLGYALADVIHLRPIYEKLKAELERSGRAGWLDEEMQTLTDPATYVVAPDEAWRRLKIRGRGARYLGVLKSLAAWRERRAQARDQPRGHVLRDEAVQEIAATLPRSATELARLRAMPRGMAQGRNADEILEAIAAGLDMPEAELPQMPPQEPPVRGLGPLTDMLKVLLKMKCEEHEVAQKLIASSADLERIAAEDEPDVPALRGWRRQLFGEAALELKAGRVALAVSGKNLWLAPMDGRTPPAPARSRADGRRRRRGQRGGGRQPRQDYPPQNPAPEG